MNCLTFTISGLFFDFFFLARARTSFMMIIRKGVFGVEIKALLAPLHALPIGLVGFRDSYNATSA